MTAEQQMRAIAQEEVGRFAEILADEFLETTMPASTVHGFWNALQRTMRRFDEKAVEVPA